MPKMIISLNYLIAITAFIGSFFLARKGELYNNAKRFLFFFGFAALIGGFVHNIKLRYVEATEFVNHINMLLPHFLIPLQLDLIIARLWFIAIECIGFAEFYFMFLFLDPVIQDKFAFIKTYLKCALAIYIVLTILSTQYFFVVAFHCFTHIIIITFSLYLYCEYKISAFLLLALLACYNILIGIMQQLMNYQIIPSGPLNYNDWYHIGIIIFVLFLYYLLTKGQLIEKLNQLNLTHGDKHAK